jgi:hypothetical protein
MMGVQAPKHMPEALSPDDSGDYAPTQVTNATAQTGTSAVATAPGIAALSAAQAAVVVTTPLAAPVAAAPPPVRTPQAPVAATTPVAPPAATPVQPQAAAPALTAADVRLVVRTLLEDSIEPLRQALVDAQRRIAELERRPAAVAPTAVTTAVVAPAPAGVRAPAPAAAAPHAPVATSAPAAYASAIAAPAQHSVAPRPTLPPLLDLEAINRDIPIDMDMRAFDGGRRKKQTIILFVVGLILVFGGLFALLAESYTHAHN